MQDTERSKALLEIFRQSLSHYGLVQTANSLGNRQDYIGVSDIASYSQCPRAAVATKLYPLQDDLKTNLVLQRGHWFENGVKDSLESIGLKLLHQLEVSIQWNYVPLKAHLDFTLVWDKPELAVRVLEVKSMNNLSDVPSPQYELQASAQVELLKACWNKPVFSVQKEGKADNTAPVTFPEICKEQLGIILPAESSKVSIEGWLLCLSMKDARAFGPYESSTHVLEEALQNGKDFWQAMENIKNGKLTLNDMEYAKGFNPLCQYCSFNSDCPKFRPGSHQPEWEESILKLEELKRQRAILDEDIKARENDLKHEGSMVQDWITTGAHRFRLTTVKGRRTLDRELLNLQLTDLFEGMGLEDMSVADFISSCEKETAQSSRLVINKIN